MKAANNVGDVITENIDNAVGKCHFLCKRQKCNKVNFSTGAMHLGMNFIRQLHFFCDE